MMLINLAKAQVNFSQVLAAVDPGEEVVIARAGLPVPRLVPVARCGVRLGLLEGIVDSTKILNFFESMG